VSPFDSDFTTTRTVVPTDITNHARSEREESTEQGESSEYHYRRRVKLNQKGTAIYVERLASAAQVDYKLCWPGNQAVLDPPITMILFGWLS
jgi:hypothetical protein